MEIAITINECVVLRSGDLQYISQIEMSERALSKWSPPYVIKIHTIRSLTDLLLA